MNQLQKDFWERTHNFRQYSHPIVKYFGTQRVDFLRKFIKADEVNNILDVGAGGGFSSFYLRSICQDIVATDFSKRMLIENPINKKILADAYFLPFRSNSFDMVCAWELFHHLDDHETAIEEIIRVARKYICVFEVNRNNPVQFLYALANKEHRGIIKFSKKYFLKLFEKKVKVIKNATGGIIFPNKTPLWIFPFLSKMPFVIPFVGISNFIICEKR